MNSVKLLFGPGIRLMRQLRIATKMSLMGLFLLVPLVLLLATTYHNGESERRFAAGELEGTRLAVQLSELVVHTQSHRGLTHRVLSGDAGASAARDLARSAMSEALRQLDAAVTETHSFDAASLWRERRETLQMLAEGRHAAQRQEAFAQHTVAIESLRQMMMLVGERSGLVLDPEANTFFLMDIALERVIPLAETLGLTRGQGAAILVRGDASNTERVQILGRMDLLTTQVSDLRHKFAALERSGSAAPSGWQESLARMEEFGRHVRTVFSADAIDGDAAGFFDRASQTMADLQRMDREVLAKLKSGLEGRRASRARSMALELGVAGAGMLLMAYFAISFYLSFVGAFRALSLGVSKVAEGNL